jgi:hypothetical protein
VTLDVRLGRGLSPLPISEVSPLMSWLRALAASTTGVLSVLKASRLLELSDSWLDVRSCVAKQYKATVYED